MDILKIKGVVKDYDWGNKEYIPSLIGGYDGEPQAELWIGTHPSGDATLSSGEKLSEYIASNHSVLGERAFSAFGKLPLLFKVLAIARPLSLQCHPNIRQAQEGWKNEADKRKRGEDCNYQDDNEKAEIIAAITPVTAMCGFRSLDEVEKNLKGIIPATFDKYFSSYQSIKELFYGIYKLHADERREILAEADCSISASSEESFIGEFYTEKGIFEKCRSVYPDDIGALFPYILNVIHLNSGEALYLNPDTLHAYVYGNGVELMSASDNVLRGGLTKKRIDLDELGRIMDFSSATIDKVHCHIDEYGRKVYETPANAFSLSSLDSGEYAIDNRHCSFMILLDGSGVVEEGGEKMDINKGDILLIPSSASRYMIKLEGKAYMAEVPECNM